MRIVTRTAIAAAAAAMLGACASSGGGGGSSDDPTTAIGCVMLAAFGMICGNAQYQQAAQQQSAAAPDSSQSTSTTSTATASPATQPPPDQPFVRWQEHIGAVTKADSRDITFVYDMAADNTVRIQPGETSVSRSTARVTITSPGVIEIWSAQTYNHVAAADQPSLPGHPGIVSGRIPVGIGSTGPTTPFLDLGDPLIPSDYKDRNPWTIGAIANPYELGWDYQSFGIWATSIPNHEHIGASNFGAATPASAVPLSGTATFSGKLAGFYVSPFGQGSIAAADVSVAADFSARSLDISSIGTTLTRNLHSSVPAPTLNLHGTMTYTPGSSVFSGTLVNAGGTMNGPSSGQFYGPAAEELGGSFALRSTTTSEAFVGAYGAKR